MNNQIIIDYYLTGKSLNQTANKFKISVYKVKKILRENRVPIRTRREQNILTNISRTKHVDHDYFDSLDEKKAYYLGFLAADGCVRPKRNEIKIGLSSIDRTWLEQFKKDLEIEREIEDYQTQNGFNISEIRFSSAKIKQVLAKYDIVPNKSHLEISMKNIPNDLKLAYIRGFFDGDGSFSWNKNTKQGMVKIVSHKRNILDEINSLFPQGKIYYFKNRDIYSLEFSTMSSIHFMNKIYENSTIELERKKQKFKEFIQFRI